MPNWIIGLVVGFVIRQIKKYGEDLDWAKVKADVEAQIRAALPDWAENAVVELALAAIDILADVLTSEDLKAIAEKLLAGDVGGALIALKDLIVKLIAPKDAKLAAQLVEACDDLACHVQAA